MPANRTCAECGAAIPPGSTDGLCTQCLFSLGLDMPDTPAPFTPAPGPLAQATPDLEAKFAPLGDYELLEEIGQGGMGIVYRARQVSLGREVAFKLIKPGMDSTQLLARFDAERAALARMDHPNIARVIDAGRMDVPLSTRNPQLSTSLGRPYFVMELVLGIPITRYCDEQRLPLRARLDLFMAVCHAIQHAHQKGIIHRDLKPSNVLVTTQDGRPAPKVIDFGIAKATQGRLTDRTVFTAWEQFIGTPAYMSPEQAQLGGLDVDTRSDIYSLGVLLYELLTGETPFDTKALVAAGLDEMRRTIREVEAVKPSTRLSQGLAARLAAPRKSEIRNTAFEIDRDLDWMVMKCLEKDRARRYESANGLARDIERHLSNEPVVARPPSSLYRFQKAVRRNKRVFTVAAAFIVLLVTAVAVSTWQAVRATRAEREQSHLLQQAQRAQANETREREKAQKESAKSQQVAQVLKDMLNSASPWQARGRDITIVKEILDKTAERLGKDWTNQPEVELELRNVLASTYMELGLLKPLEQMAQESLRLCRRLFGEDSAETTRALYRLGAAKRHLKDSDEAEVLLREVCNRIKAQPKYRLLPDNAWVANTFEQYGLVLNDQRKDDEAEAVFREGIRWASQEFGAENDAVAALLRDLGLPLRRQGRWPEALAAQRRALALFRKIYGEEHPSVAQTLTFLGSTLKLHGDLGEAEDTLRNAVLMHNRVLGKDHDSTGDAIFQLRDIVRRQGKLAEAEILSRDLYAIKKKVRGPSAGLLLDIIDLLEAQGKHSEGVALCRQELPELRAAVAPNNCEFGNLLALFAQSLNSEASFTEAEAAGREALAVLKESVPDSWPRFRAESTLGASLLGKRELAEAEYLLVSGYEGLKQRQEEIPARDHSRYLNEAVAALVKLYTEWEKPAQAQEWREKLAQSGNSSPAAPSDPEPK